MKKEITKMMSLLTALLVAFATLVAPITTWAAPTDCYCYPTYSSTDGCDVVIFYTYDSTGTAVPDSNRRLIKDGNTLKTGRGDIISEKYKSGSNVSWYNSNLVVWQHKNNSVYIWNYSTKTNKRFTKNAQKILLNYDSFAATIVKKGKTYQISSLLAEGGMGYGNGIPTKTETSTKEVITETNANTQKVTVTFGSHIAESYRNEVTLDNRYKLSEYCKSGIRYLAVTKDSGGYYIFVYEDDSNSIYRFDLTDIFNPVKVSFSGTLKSVTFNKKGYGDKLVTSAGTFSLSSLQEEVDAGEAVSVYAINKKSYSMLYKAGTKYKLTVNNGILALDATTVTSGIASKSKQFGFDEDNIYFILNNTEYKAPLSNPTASAAIKSNVKKLTYSKSNGFVTGTE